MDVDPTPESEVPLATLWPPDPTRRDRLKAWGLLLGGTVLGGALSFQILLLLAPVLFPKPEYLIVIRASPQLGAAAGGVLFGMLIGLLAIELHLYRRFKDPRDRLIFERMLRRSYSRESAQQYADQYGRADRIATFVSLMLIFVFGLYCWLAWSTMYLGADYETIGWRGFSLIEHQRAGSDVAAIYRTSIYRERTKESRPCLVLHLVDRTVVSTEELSPTDAQITELEMYLQVASQKTAIAVPWLQQVPAPR